MSMQVGFRSPPQVSPKYVRLLATCHVQALFALLTTEDHLDPLRSRILPAGQVSCFAHYAVRDWGNPQLLEIASRVKSWPCHANVSVAEGYFRAVLRRPEGEAWFWALEWNKFLRVVGTIAHEDSKLNLFPRLPPLGWMMLPDESGRIRTDVPLPRGEDPLFPGNIIDGAPSEA